MKESFQRQLDDMVFEVMQGRSYGQVAAAMGVSASQIYKWTEGRQHFPAFRLRNLFEATGDPRVYRCLLPDNAYLVFTREPDRLNSDVYNSEAASIGEDADVHRAVTLALADGVVTTDELSDILRECRESITAKLSVMASVEAAAGIRKIRQQEEQLCVVH